MLTIDFFICSLRHVRSHERLELLTSISEAVLKIETGTQTEAAQTEPEDKPCMKIRNRGNRLK